MRVISGHFKGRRLASFKYKHIRPTTDMVKEGIFNRLSSTIQGARVLDLFSGTGSLSIEALSRGAKEVVAIEKHPQSLKVIHENIQQLGIQSEVKVIREDVMKFLKKYRGNKFDLILIDPPFTQKIAHDIMVVLSLSQIFHEKSFVAIESGRHERLDEAYGVFELSAQKSYGDKKASFFSPPR